MASSAPATPQPEKPKTLWDSILTSTPVVLTVVATLLAGLSSSEMTRAQYHRSLAAQHQSKVGDQWGFFQAKRIRGTSMEIEVEQLRTQFALVAMTPDAIAKYAERLPKEFGQAAKDVERLSRAIGTAKGELDAEIKRLQQDAQAGAAQWSKKQIDAALARPEMREAISYLDMAKLPDVPPRPVGDEKIREAHAAILARRTETETSPLMAQISEDKLREEIDAAESVARAFDDKGKPIERELTELGRLLWVAANMARSLHRDAERIAALLNDPTPAKDGASAELHTAGAALNRTAAALKNDAETLNTSFVAVRRDYTARRYRREANDNQEIAGILEIQVRKSSWQAERHRTRSQLFFIGMLVAQAGVTIATFALALRQRSILWVLATVAGLAAIFFSGYVYLYR